MALYRSFLSYCYVRPVQSNYRLIVRSISSMEITKNITLLSNDKKKGKAVNFKLQETEEKPLVIMLSWLMARKKHIFKYADFYLDRGFDVMNVSITPWQVLWPVKGTQLVATDILKFLDGNGHYGPLVVHGFSVGGYVWSEALVQLKAQQSQYQSILDRLAGQVWDSLADITEIPQGFPFAVFPRNRMMQTALRQYILYHMRTFDKVATCHYLRASQLFHTNIVKAPALFFISKTDPIGAESSNKRARDNWQKMGIQTYWKCWDDSPHVGHFRHYPEEYMSELSNFMEIIGCGGKQKELHLIAKAKL